MTPLNAQLFAEDAVLNLRDVVLSQSDAPQTFREKLARVILDEMYQFIGLLDVNGMTLEINRAALEGAGTHLDEIQGRPFWDDAMVAGQRRDKGESSGTYAGGRRVASLSAATLRSMDGPRAKRRL